MQEICERAITRSVPILNKVCRDLGTLRPSILSAVASRPRIVDRVEQCAWCLRTILTGEQPERFVTEERETVPVCELCTPAADDHGWTRADHAAALGMADDEGGGSRRESRLLRLFARRGADPDPDREPAPRRRDPLDAADAYDRRATAAAIPGAADLVDEQDDTATGVDPVTGAAAGETAVRPPLDVDAVDVGALLVPALHPQADDPVQDRLAVAVLLFNESSSPRLVSGIAKSLGEPEVSVVAVGERRPEVVVTVAWELSWYQFLVDDEQLRQPVRQLRRGEELGELPDEWRHRNGVARTDGTLLLTGPPPAPAAGP